MQRITYVELDALVHVLNDITGQPFNPWGPGDDGKSQYNVGNYHLDSAYGVVSLVQNTEGGGERTIIGRCTKRELYDRMHALIEGFRIGVGTACHG